MTTALCRSEHLLQQEQKRISISASNKFGESFTRNKNGKVAVLKPVFCPRMIDANTRIQTRVVVALLALQIRSLTLTMHLLEKNNSASPTPFS